MWSDLAELPRSGATAPSTSQPARAEFGADVAAALADLRSRHGLTTVSSAAEGNTADEIDAIRAELQRGVSGVNRRGLLQLTGAAAVFALAGCWHKDPDTLVPHANQPEGTTTGNAVWYSTTLRSGGRAVAVIAKTYDGRPIKLEGNPDCPLNNGTVADNQGNVARGKLDTRTQASLMDLYDPDRRQTGPGRKQGDALQAIGWDELDATVGAALKQGPVTLITGPIDGPARRQLIDDLKKAFGARLTHAAYDAYAPDAAIAARGLAFGDAHAKPATLRLERASVIVTLGSDLLGGGQTGLPEQIGFGDFRRRIGHGEAATTGQLISFEPTLSQTGALADVRVRCAMGELAIVAWAIADEVAKLIGATLPASARQALDANRGALALKPIASAEHAEGLDPIAYTARQLVAAKGKGLVYVGGATHCGANSVPLHVAANYLNAILGNEGVTIETGSNAASAITPSISATERALTAASGGTLIVVDANPVFSLPMAEAAVKAATTVVVLADRGDETLFAGNDGALLAPTPHGLESWGDAEPRAGVFCLQQPCIQPLWDSRAAEESLMAFAVAAGVAPDAFKAAKPEKAAARVAVCSRAPLWDALAHGVRPWQDYVRSVWLAKVRQGGGDERAFWTAALARGCVGGATAADSAAPAFNDAALAGAAPVAPTAPARFELVLSASRIMRDGAQANNAWLQETSDPVSKATWDNYLAVSTGDWQKLGLPWYAKHTVVTLTVGAAKVKVPVHMQEGQHPGTLELFLGWGRTRAGQIAMPDDTRLRGGIDGVTVNGFALEGAGHQRWGLAADATLEIESYEIANTQSHHHMDGRDVALDDVVELHRKDPKLEARGHHHALWQTGADGREHGRLNLWGHTHIFPGRRWGMVIDMNQCIACQACVVACTVENNVPVVGRDEVRKGREMHWIRIDRYYSGHSRNDKRAEERPGDQGYIEKLDVEVVFQPMLCQHCGHAPCEEVCPATATMRNEEGLNIQVYNRCIGTRYCSNNCPYKVRRFNFYEYSKYRAGPHGSGAPFDRVVGNLVSEGSTSSQAELSQRPLEMVLNPEITVRSKGVMEKCNFCVQRTREVREVEKASGRKHRDGAITTACAQACPTEAIVFGDINDESTRVSRTVAAAPTGYAYLLLDKELNTRPSVAYLRRLRHRPVTAEDVPTPHAAHGPRDAAGTQGFDDEQSSHGEQH
ncbi:MAG TPA: 4Fe-4S dicluster domain-containing protein [Planctomycetota bacterium]|nr:4Fe-4S dicluster domain-containing protein [Planctomycetota bacterium]